MLRISPPVHPGEILREEFLKPLGLAPYSLAKELGIPRTRLERLARELNPVTPDTALRLSRYFRTSAEFWMNLQTAYDLTRAEAQSADQLAAISPREAA